MGTKRTLLPILGLCVGAMAAHLSAQSDANKQVYNFCVQHQGQQVGDGICQTLVNEALHSARASENHGYGKEVWRISSTARGVVISGDYNKVLPGDIVYFHDIFPDRYRYKGASEQSLLPDRQRSNHVGVVDYLTLDGVRYFDQNAGNQKVVKSNYFSFNDNLNVVDYVAIFRNYPFQSHLSVTTTIPKTSQSPVDPDKKRVQPERVELPTF